MNAFQGNHGSGGSEYTADQYGKVVAFLEEQTRMVTAEDICSATGVGGRTVRAILSDADGVDFVLILGDGGYGVASSIDEVEPGSRRLASQARRMAERAERRDQYAARNLRRVQQVLSL